ncbi:MAG: pentapeptide repeat-containing protein [Thermomicrobiales bacterium]
MDRETFDALAQLLGTAGTRRAAVGALIGVTVTGHGFSDETDAKKKKRRRKRKNKPQRCYGTNACPPPESGKDLDDCDYSNTDVFVDAIAGGSSFRRSNFTGAVLDGADLQGTKFLNANLRGASLQNVDLQGASLNGACLLDADFTGAVIAGPIFADAFLCQTAIHTGEVFDRDCAILPSCCLA